MLSDLDADLDAGVLEEVPALPLFILDERRTSKKLTVRPFLLPFLSDPGDWEPCGRRRWEDGLPPWLLSAWLPAGSSRIDALCGGVDGRLLALLSSNC